MESVGSDTQPAGSRSDVCWKQSVAHVRRVQFSRPLLHLASAARGRAHLYFGSPQGRPSLAWMDNPTMYMFGALRAPNI
jgi:hypothetical protein